MEEPSLIHQQKWKTSWPVYYHPLFNFHRPASLFKRHISISAGLYTHRRTIHRNPANHMIFTFKLMHSTTKWNKNHPGHGASNCIMSSHHVIASLRSVPSSCVLCTEFTSLRIKCLTAPSLFSLAASSMSRPWWCCWSFVKNWCMDMFGECLKDLKPPNQDLEETCKRLKRAEQESQNELTAQCFWRWKNSGQHAKLLIHIHTNKVCKEAPQMRKETGIGEKVKAGLAKNGSSKSIKPDKASMLTCLRCRVSGANAAPLKLTRQNYSCAAAPLSFAIWLLTGTSTCGPLQCLWNSNYNSPQCQVQVLSSTLWQQKEANYASKEQQRTR